MKTYKTWSSLRQAISHRFGNGHLAGAGFHDEYLNKRIDSLKAMVLDLAKNQDTIKRDLDTLKGGQKIIFDEVKKNSNKNFWSLF